MSMLPTFNSDSYDDGRTKQAFADDADINKLLARAAKGDTISHLAKHGAVYGDFTDIDDLLVAHERLARGQAIFDELPGELKREFNQDARTFFNFVNDPANQADLARVLPGLAAPGTQMPAVRRTAATEGANPPSPTAAPPEAPAEPPEAPVEPPPVPST